MLSTAWKSPLRTRVWDDPLMFLTRRALPRRTFLRGLGTAVALPFLDSMVPALAQAQRGRTSPVRMAFVYVPNGIDMRHWNPLNEGALADLPQTLAPLAPIKQDILLLGNLTIESGRALLDGPGDHGRCCGSYLTGVQVKKTVSDIKASVSCDELVANQIGRQTRFPSIEVGLEDARQAGDCDSGYSRAYTNNLAWRNEAQPLPPVLDPRALFERLFGDGAELGPEARALAGRSSVAVCWTLLPTTPAYGRVNSARPIDAVSTRTSHRSVRSNSSWPRPIAKTRGSIPVWRSLHGVPSYFAEHFKLMTDMITVAFRADLTRVVTFLVTREGTSRAYREIGIADGHHPLTHHRNVVEQMDKVALINRYHVEQFGEADCHAEGSGGRRSVGAR